MSLTQRWSQPPMALSVSREAADSPRRSSAVAQLLVVRPTYFMTIRITLSVVAGLILLSAGYIAGYTRGHRAAAHDDLVFDLRHNLMLYRLATQGDTNRLDDRLRFSIYACSATYDRDFGSLTVTNQYLAKDLTEARAIASQERTNVVVFSNSASLMKLVKERIVTNGTKP